MGFPRTTPQVVEYILAHPNKPITVNELMSGTGLDRTQVLNVMGSQIREQRLAGLRVLTRAFAWQYDPDAAPAEQASTQEPLEGIWYQSIGTTASGKVLVRAEGDDGASPVYVLTPLDI